MIDILLATHNGERYLGDFIASLARQSYRDFQLIAIDDASSDGSAGKLRGLCAEYRVRLGNLEESAAHRGIVDAYDALVQSSRSQYLCFADQDDTWHPEKLERMLKRMRENEARHGGDVPLLIHSDLRVCDRNLFPVHESFVHYQRLSPENCALNRILVQNSVTGCAAMFNRALADLIAGFPAEAIFHDWFTAITAAAFGVIDYIPEPLVQYRQHGGNHLGAVRYGWNYFRRSAGGGRESLHGQLVRTQRQAYGFYKKNEARLSPAQREIILGWADIDRKGFWKKRLIALKGCYVKNTLSRTVGLLWTL